MERARFVCLLTMKIALQAFPYYFARASLVRKSDFSMGSESEAILEALESRKYYLQLQKQGAEIVQKVHFGIVRL